MPCSYFNENQYPDEAKREEIANACNAVIQKPGKGELRLQRPAAFRGLGTFPPKAGLQPSVLCIVLAIIL